MIDRQVQHLVRLVDDLLDVSRITRGKIRLQTEAVDLAAVVERAVETSRPLIDARGHELTVALPPEPVRVRGDPVRLAQVLANLLNNAAKYTEEGGRIWLTVGAGRSRGGRPRARHRHRHPGRDAAARLRPVHPGGPVAGPLAGRAGHRPDAGPPAGRDARRPVQAFSAGPGQGSEFVVRLPALAEEARRERRGQRRRAGAAGRRPALPGAGRGRQHRRGREPGRAAAPGRARGARRHDGPAALAAADAFQPELVLLDIGLPGMDGYEVARRLRARPGLDKVLLVALTRLRAGGGPAPLPRGRLRPPPRQARRPRRPGRAVRDTRAWGTNRVKELKVNHRDTEDTEKTAEKKRENQAGSQAPPGNPCLGRLCLGTRQFSFCLSLLSFFSVLSSLCPLCLCG